MNVTPSPQRCCQQRACSAARETGGRPSRADRGGLAPGFVQGNLAILPAPLASDFLRFCQLNPKPCPLIDTSVPDDPRVPELGEDLDIRICRAMACGGTATWLRRTCATSGATIW